MDTMLDLNLPAAAIIVGDFIRTSTSPETWEKVWSTTMPTPGTVVLTTRRRKLTVTARQPFAVRSAK